MLFRQLEYFVSVAREQHFARAAAACYVSQPALSASIAKLERELGVTLINRGRAFSGLTAEGERLVVWARRILAERDTFTTEVAAVRTGVTGNVRLGSEPTASTTLALPVSAFCAAHPLARVQISTRQSAIELHRKLCEFELDVAIAHFAPEDRSGLLVAPLYEEHYVALAGDDRLLPRQRTMTWSDAAQLPLALLTPDMRIRQVIDRAFDVAGVQVNPHVESESVASLCAMVAGGEWATIVPHTWLQALPVAITAKTARLVDPVAHATISVAVNSTEPGSIAARAFFDIAQHLCLNEFYADPDVPRRV